MSTELERIAPRKFRAWCWRHQDGYQGGKPTAQRWADEHNAKEHHEAVPTGAAFSHSTGGIMSTIPKEYRKKPIVIEALQWDGTAESATPIISWALESGGLPIRYHEHLMDGNRIAHPDPFLWVDTLEGRMIASRGDFIIKGVNGEFYPCKADIFAKTYESIEDAK